VAVGLLARLSRHVLKRRWLLGVAGGLLVFLMPGVIVRMVTISDINLALPLVLLTVTELWIAWERQSSRRLLLCGGLVGCCVLTDLYLAEMVPLFALVAFSIWWRSEGRRQVAIRTVVSGAIAGVIVAPWLIFNEIKYHALTASNIAKREQLAIVNPQHLRFTLGQLPGLTVSNLFQPLIPQEWGDRIIGHALYSYSATLFQVLLIPAAVVLALLLGRRAVSDGYWILIVPWICNIVLCWYIDIGQQWESGSMVPRYIYPTLAPLALFSVAALLTLSSRLKPLLVLMAVSTGFLIVLWVHLVPTIHTS
jgi:4-amino-4-deoxy-L-arabinose transferase-like glycosyltransferase